MRQFPYLLLFAFIVCGCGLFCRKSQPSAPGTDIRSFSRVFEAFRDSMSTHYVYWDIDTTDWDAMFRRYEPLFVRLDIADSADCQKSVACFRDMTAGLIDGHFTLSFEIPAIHDSILFPSFQRHLLDPDFHAPFDYARLDTADLDRSFVAGTFTPAGGSAIRALCGTIRGHILYFSCSNFYLQAAWNTSQSNGVRTVLDSFSAYLQSPKITGLILDVRNNPGGDLTDLSFLIGRLIDQPFHLGQSRYKNGPGRFDFTPWISVDIENQPGFRAFAGPVKVLADRYSISTAEAVAMAIHGFPNGQVIGERTWGATGPVALESLYNAGSFRIPGILSVYASSASFRYLDGTRYEGRGFPPDIFVPFQPEKLEAGIDPALDTAISLLK